jgi:DNA-binding response OmpR family regulator
MHAERISQHVDDVLRVGALAVSPEAASQCWLDDRPLRLTARQVRMLAVLVRASGALVRRDELYRATTGRDLPAKSRAVDMDLWRIRKELGRYGEAIRSVRKVGYGLDLRMIGHIQATEP